MMGESLADPVCDEHEAKALGLQIRVDGLPEAVDVIDA
jgi:hypothetical protein